MLIFTPIDLPKIEPDSWDIFWGIWNKHSAPLVKVRQNADSSIAEIGSTNIWTGIDIYDKYNNTMPYTAPYVDIQHLLPNMYKQLLAISPDLYRVRLLQSQTSIASHTDDNKDRWNIRAFLHGDSCQDQWYFTKPYDSHGQRTYIKMPVDTNWFMYNDKYCWHGTDFDSTNKKILLQAFCLDPKLPKLLDSSTQKYKEYTLEF
jgi:hypothetical protein